MISLFCFINLIAAYISQLGALALKIFAEINALEVPKNAQEWTKIGTNDFFCILGNHQHFLRWFSASSNNETTLLPKANFQLCMADIYQVMLLNQSRGSKKLRYKKFLETSFFLQKHNFPKHFQVFTL